MLESGYPLLRKQRKGVTGIHIHMIFQDFVTGRILAYATVILGLKLSEWIEDNMQALGNQGQLDFNFDRIYSTHKAMVRKVVKGFHFHDAAADDLIQDIFILAWTKRSYLKDLDAISGWLKTIAYNQCLNLTRVQKLQKKRLVSLECFDHEIEAPESRTLFEISLQQFEEHMDVLEGLIRHHSHAARREVATLFYLEHKSIHDIAGLLNMKQNTVLSHLRRFRLIVTAAMQQWLKESTSP